MSASDVLARLLRQLRPFWGWLSAVVAIDLLAIPIALATPLALQVAVDHAIGSVPMPAWGQALLPAGLEGSKAGAVALAVGLVIALALASQLQRNGAWLLQAWIGQRIVVDFRAQMFRQVQRLSLTYHDTRGTSDSLYRIQHDATALQWVSVYGLSPVLTALGTLLGMFAVLWTLDTALAMVALAVIPPLVWLTRSFGHRTRVRWHVQKERESAVNSVLQEVLTGLRVVKAFGQERREETRFVERSHRELDASLAVVRLQVAFYALSALVLAAGTAAALWIGVRSVQAGSLTLGQLTMVMAYLAQLYAPLETLTQKLTELQGSLAGAERAFALLDEKVDVQDRPGAKALQRARGEFELREASYGYPGSKPVLRQVSARIPEGTRVGIVGRTGAGKTTLMNLLTRFLDPDSGAVLLDGMDLRDIRLEDLRRQFAIVLQEPVLFSTTIADNIAYGRPDATPAQIEAAARAANAHDFISALPDGYLTAVGERGMTLSGGERQRIALARAFLKDAPVLILDEPTSAIDQRTEAGIIEAMERLMHGRTTFIVAHRLVTLRHCDVVYAVDDGRLVPASVETSEPLMANRGLAAELQMATD